MVPVGPGSAAGPSPPASLAVYLRLGRVSNLPTVWTNVLAGAVLAGGRLEVPALMGLLLALSLFYVGGMYLNDAFDRHVDARERPERPIPAGLVSARRVFAIGFVMLGAGVLVVGAVAATQRPEAWAAAVVTGLALAVTIIYYDVRHKRDPLSPLVMGLCRVLVYFTAAMVVTGRLTAPVIGGALVLLTYLIGLTYIAKQETLAEVRNLWPLAFIGAPFVYGLPALVSSPFGTLIYLGFGGWVVYAVSLLVRRQGRSIPRAVVALLAGISLLDALLVAGAGAPALAPWALGGFVLTRVLQRWIPAT